MAGANPGGFRGVQPFRHAATLHCGTMTSSTTRAERLGVGLPISRSRGAEASADRLAFATAKSFGDFVIAHSVLHRVEASVRNRLRLISNTHVRDLNAILPDNVCVTLIDLESDRVPALFDIRKRGVVAACKSAWSLRRELRKVERRHNEMLAFTTYGVRERFIAGGWTVVRRARRGDQPLPVPADLPAGRPRALPARAPGRGRRAGGVGDDADRLHPGRGRRAGAPRACGRPGGGGVGALPLRLRRRAQRGARDAGRGLRGRHLRAAFLRGGREGGGAGSGATCSSTWASTSCA